MGRRKNKSSDTLRSLSNSLTIHSFANAAKIPNNSSSKLPKSFSVGALTNVAAVAVVDEDVDVDTEDEDELEDGVPRKVKLKKAKKKIQNVVQEVDNGQEGRRIPYDLWELISGYILPCCVGKFAAICQDSYRVIQRPAFWVKLYRDFYHFGCDLPDHLQPENILQQTHGLR